MDNNKAKELREENARLSNKLSDLKNELSHKEDVWRAEDKKRSGYNTLIDDQAVATEELQQQHKALSIKSQAIRDARHIHNEVQKIALNNDTANIMADMMIDRMASGMSVSEVLAQTEGNGGDYGHLLSGTQATGGGGKPASVMKGYSAGGDVKRSEWDKMSPEAKTQVMNAGRKVVDD